MTPPEDGKRPAIGERSIDTRLMHKHLRTLKIGDMATYEELGELLGRSGRWVQTTGHARLRSSVRIALREDHMVFGSVPRVGVKRLDDEGIIATAGAATTHIRRTAHRAMEKVAKGVQDYNALSNVMKTQHNLYATMLALTQSMTRRRTLAGLEKGIEEAAGVLPLQKALTALGEIL